MRANYIFQYGDRYELFNAIHHRLLARRRVHARRSVRDLVADGAGGESAAGE